MCLADVEDGKRGMVKGSRFAGRVVLLTAVAIILVAFALNMAWYSYSSTTTVAGPGDSSWSWSESLEIHEDHIMSSRLGYLAYPEPGMASGSYWVPFIDLFLVERTLIELWVLAGLVFMGLVLIDSPLGSMITGSFLLLIGLLMIVSFVLGIADAIYDTTYVPARPEPHGFYGADTAQWTDGTYTTTVMIEYGPAAGIATVILAFAAQAVAFMTRAYVAMPAIFKDWVKTDDEVDDAKELELLESVSQEGPREEQSREERVWGKPGD